MAIIAETLMSAASPFVDLGSSMIDYTDFYPSLRWIIQTIRRNHEIMSSLLFSSLTRMAVDLKKTTPL